MGSLRNTEEEKEMTQHVPKRVNKWIQKAIKKEGALTEYVKRKYGSYGFTERGTIKVAILNDIIHDPRTNRRTKARARLAKRLRRYGRKKR